VRGRDREWRAVLDLLRRVEDGRAGALLVDGEPGVGKSRLLAEAAGHARARGFAVACAAAEELGELVPLAPLVAALGVPVAGDEPEAGLADRLRAVLEERAAARPVLVALDDLHFADPGTLMAIRTLHGRLAHRRVAWLLARSPQDDRGAGRLFAALERAGARRLELAPLPPDAIAQVAADTAGAPPGPGLLDLVAGAGGNPGLVVDLLAGLRDENALDLTGGHARPRSARPPERLGRFARERLARLGREARHLVELAAVLGRPFTPEDVGGLLGTTPAALLPALEEALGAGLLAPYGDAIGFRHELVRRAILAALPGPVRHALHRQIGEHLIAGGGPPAEAARHLALGVRHGDHHALACLDAAVARILPASPAAAAGLAVRAFELTAPADPRRPARALAAVEAATAAGRLAEAAQLAENALAEPPPPAARAGLAAAYSHVVHLRGQAEAALHHAEAALRDADAAGLTGDVRDRALRALLDATAARGDDRTARHHAEAVLANEDRHDHAVLVTALTTLAITEWNRGRLADALAHARAAVRRASAAPTRGLHPGLVLAEMLTDLGHHDEARAVLRETAHAIDTLADAPWRPAVAALHARLALATGHLDKAIAAADAVLGRTRRSPASTVPRDAVSSRATGLDGVPAANGHSHLSSLPPETAPAVPDGPERSGGDGNGTDELAPSPEPHPASEAPLPSDGLPPPPHLFAPAALAVRCAAELRKGDLRAAAACLPASGDVPHPATHATLRLRLLAARLTEAREGPERAFTLVTDLIASLDENRWPLFGEPGAAAWLVRLALAAGDRARAARVAAAADRLARDNPDFPCARSAAAHTRGLLASDLAALACAEDEAPDRWARASAAEDLGVALAASGDRNGGITALLRALAAYQEAGATRDTARVRRRLRRLGVRRRHWSQADRPVSGWDSLTDTERAIARLVAEGHTNRQIADRLFISAHTVAFHLRQVFRKLGLHSRVQLARLVLDREHDHRA